MKIVICGGHHNSALVVAEELKRRGEEIFWFGHRKTMIGDRKLSAEYLEVTKKGIPFYEIKAGKFQTRYKFWENLWRIPLGFGQSLFLLLKIKPDLIFSFGGYLALPVALTGSLLGIPVVTHEQTVVSGIGNRLIAKVARKIFITFPSSIQDFPRKKVVLTGLPLRPEIFEKGKYLFKNKKRTIYVTGGKQGAHVINEAVFSILPWLLARFNLIHQCGSTSLFNDIDKAEELKKHLGENKENYLVKEYFFIDEIGAVFNSADFVISRSGAHTIYELASLGKPAILIPLPWSNENEQEENAKMIVSLGLAKILPQKELEAGKLRETILDFEKNLSSYKLRQEFELPKTDPTKKIIEEIDKLGLKRD